MNERITIIGDGAMGTLCAIMLAENGRDVTLWSAFAEQAAELAKTRRNDRFLPGSRLPDSVRVTPREADAFQDAGWCLNAVPTQYVRRVWSRLAEHCPQAAGICSVTKGVENATLLRPTQILQDVLGPAHTGPLAALSGPSIAPEILNHCPASVAVASADADFAGRIQQQVSRPYFRVYTNPDPLGVELAGATKNVIAIAAGVLDGLEAGDNAKAALLTRGLTEITRLGVAMGAQAETFAGLAGFGDLVTTCFSPVGRNRTFGEAVGRGRTVAEALEATESVVEGVPTTRSVIELAQRHQVEMPITRAVADVLFEHKPAREAIQDLMNRPLKAERVRGMSSPPDRNG